MKVQSSKTIFSSLLICCALVACSSIATEAPEPYMISAQSAAASSPISGTHSAEPYNLGSGRTMCSQGRCADIPAMWQRVRQTGDYSHAPVLASDLDVAIRNQVNSELNAMNLAGLASSDQMSNFLRVQAQPRFNRGMPVPYSKIKFLQDVCYQGNRKACAIVYTIEQLRNDCQTGLQQGCMYLNNLLNALNSADQYVRGYTRSNGTYVRGYYRSRPDGNPYNNYSTRRNINQYRRVYRRIRH